MIPRTIYQKAGYHDREGYLKSLAHDLGISQDIVDAAAEILGESEDFDGLVTTLEDYADSDDYGYNEQRNFD